MEDEGKEGNLEGATVFLATDNSTVEGCLYKGNSPVKKLFELVVRVKRLELLYGCVILVTHISGDRMQAEGTDGISRGLFKEGVSTCLDMLSFCPWHKSALEISGKLKEWLKQTIPLELTFLEPEDWFYRGHDLNGGSRP